MTDPSGAAAGRAPDAPTTSGPTAPQPAATANEPPGGTAGATSMPWSGPLPTHASSGAVLDGCDAPDAFAPLVPSAEETCWTFAAHGASAPGDTSPFDISVDESYSQFYYDVPWPAGSLASRFGAQLDDRALLRHALVFSSTAAHPDGTVVPFVTGTTLGEDAELLAAWSPGACNVRYPDDFGGKLPDGGKIMVQWHHYNATGEPKPDRSAMVICTVPAGSRAHVGGLTMLGTENLGDLHGFGAGIHAFSSECVNDSRDPIAIVGLKPFQHMLGIRTVTVDHDPAGGGVTILDQPFAVEHQVHYLFAEPHVLAPGRKLTTTCVYDNDSGAKVSFGQSAHQEFCYQLAFAYPYGALNNSAPSLIGATNTCW